MSNLDDYKKAAQELNDIDHQSDETRLAGEQYELLSDILCDVQTYSIRMVRQELRGDEISPSQAIRQILNWHETEKQKLYSLIEELTDADDCDYDHHNYCQAHSLHDNPCPHSRAKVLLNKYRNNK